MSASRAAMIDRLVVGAVLPRALRLWYGNLGDRELAEVTRLAFGNDDGNEQARTVDQFVKAHEAIWLDMQDPAHWARTMPLEELRDLCSHAVELFPDNGLLPMVVAITLVLREDHDNDSEAARVKATGVPRGNQELLDVCKRVLSQPGVADLDNRKQLAALRKAISEENVRRKATRERPLICDDTTLYRYRERALERLQKG